MTKECRPLARCSLPCCTIFYHSSISADEAALRLNVSVALRLAAMTAADGRLEPLCRDIRPILAGRTGSRSGYDNADGKPEIAVEVGRIQIRLSLPLQLFSGVIGSADNNHHDYAPQA